MAQRSCCAIPESYCKIEDSVITQRRAVTLQDDKTVQENYMLFDFVEAIELRPDIDLSAEQELDVGIQVNTLNDLLPMTNSLFSTIVRNEKILNSWTGVYQPFTFWKRSKCVLKKCT